MGGVADFPAAKQLRLPVPHVECNCVGGAHRHRLLRLADRLGSGSRLVVGRKRLVLPDLWSGRASEKVEFKKNAARTLLFPRRLFGLAKPGDPFDREQKTLEAASTWINATPLSRWLRWLAGLLNTPGYVGPEGHIYEGHVFSALAAFIFLGIYLLLWPMAAPVPAFRWSLLALGFLAFVAGVLVWLLWKDDSAARVEALRYWKIGLTTAVVAFVASIALLYLLTNAERFPILSTTLIV